MLGKGCTYNPDLYTVPSRLVLTSVSIALAVVSLIGNVVVFRVITVHNSLKTNPTYIIMLSLIVADIFVSCLTQPMFVSLQFLGRSPHYCQVATATFIIGCGSCTASCCSVILVTVDRYIYIMKPLRYYSIVTTKYVYISLVCIWSSSFAFSATAFFLSKKAFCTVLFVGSTVAFTFMLGFYLKILQTVRSKTHNLSKRIRHRHQKQTAHTSKLTALAFVLCWYPWIVMVLISAHDSRGNAASSITFASLYYWLLELGMSNSGLNVFIFSWKNSVLRLHIRRYFGAKNLEDEEESTPSFTRINMKRRMTFTRRNMCINKQTHLTSSDMVMVGSISDASCIGMAAAN